MSAPIRDLELNPFRLPLRRPWRFGPHQLHERRGWLLRLTDADGCSGWGEATPLPQIGTESPARTLAWLHHGLAGLTGKTPQQALADLAPAAGAPPAARCGLECALLDLQARHLGRPLGQLLQPAAGARVAVHAALGNLQDDIDVPLAAAAADGFRRVKLKLGSATPTRDRARLKRVLANLPAGLKLRLDANRAWTPEKAHGVLTDLDPDRVDLVEEPLRRGDTGQWQELQAALAVPLGLDESLTPRNLEPLLVAAPVRVLVLKPMRLGGLLPCLDIAARARRVGMDCLVTTSLDGAVAGAAAVHLAAALDAAAVAAGARPQYHGLATADLLQRDLARPFLPARGAIELPHGPGLGLDPDPASLESA